MHAQLCELFGAFLQPLPGGAQLALQHAGFEVGSLPGAAQGIALRAGPVEFGPCFLETGGGVQ